jgi:hypothetical protein
MSEGEAPRYWVYNWDSAGLPPRTQEQRCAHHMNQCAYRDDDPAYCEYCHVPWARIELDEDYQGHDEHFKVHREERERRAASAKKRAAHRAAHE